MYSAWYINYHNRPDFLAFFDSEQDYVDAMFILLIWHNFGVLLRPDQLISA